MSIVTQRLLLASGLVTTPSLVCQITSELKYGKFAQMPSVLKSFVQYRSVYSESWATADIKGAKSRKAVAECVNFIYNLMNFNSINVNIF